MKNFDDIYKEVLPLLKKLQRQRRVYRLLKFIGYGALQLLILLLVVYVVYITFFIFTPDTITGFFIRQGRRNADKLNYIYSLQLVFFLFIPLSFLYTRIRRKQQEIFSLVVKHVAPNFQFIPHAIIPKNCIDHSKLLSKQLEKNENAYVMSDGKLKGKIDGVDIELADISLLNSSRKIFFLYYIPGINFLMVALLYLRPLFTRRSVEDFSDFKGLFMTADFHKQLHGTTVVLPDVLEKR